MRCLVTGGAGFIGSNLVHYLIGLGHEVLNLDALTYAGNRANLDPVSDDPRLTFVHGDICDADVVDALVGQADVVIHFAAESHVDRSIEIGRAHV